MGFKLFCGLPGADLERAIADWMAREQPRRVLHFAQVAVGPRIAVSFVFEARSDDAAAVEAATEAATGVPKAFEDGLGGADLDPNEEPDLPKLPDLPGLPEADLPY